MAFGPVVMVGFGGVLVEVMKDVAFAAAPLTVSEADAMLSSLKASRVLEGVRGRPPVDRAALCSLLVNVSRLAATAGPRLSELDLNPVMAGAGGSVAVDWLMISGRDSK
jgi:acyl-CoA synthetase (NDP forming)